MKKLLITIPSYRQPEMLERALTGLSVQTFKDFNVIIVDDNSSIDLEKIITNYKDTLDISIIVNNTNVGAMNNLFKSITLETDSKYVFSHHEDDFIKSNYLELAINILENNETISYVLTSGEWVHRDSPFINKNIEDSDFEIFNNQKFVDYALNNKHFIFGSVIYRKKHINVPWEYSIYNVLCDRVFLLNILEKNQTYGAFIKESGIFERDHSLDNIDTRASTLRQNHVISLFIKYKETLDKTTLYKKNNSLITNALLFTYSSLPYKTNFFSFYQQQKKYKLLNLIQINSLGLYAILTMSLGTKLKLKLIKLLKR
jgi:glycosyltransferase involved in cell wall biosynthesis